MNLLMSCSCTSVVSKSACKTLSWMYLLHCLKHRAMLDDSPLPEISIYGYCVRRKFLSLRHCLETYERLLYKIGVFGLLETVLYYNCSPSPHSLSSRLLLPNAVFALFCKGHANNTKHSFTYFIIAGRACVEKECPLKTKGFFRFKPLQISVNRFYLIVVFWLLK